jgi:hypothetical protein
MTWFLFVLYLHTDKPAEVYRWQFENQLACVNAAKFVSQGNAVKAACIQDGYGAEVRGELNTGFAPGELKEAPIEEQP